MVTSAERTPEASGRDVAPDLRSPREKRRCRTLPSRWCASAASWTRTVHGRDSVQRAWSSSLPFLAVRYDTHRHSTSLPVYHSTQYRSSVKQGLHGTKQCQRREGAFWYF
ncbi:unnamed protein product [Miscanthus lutarioriparius]|uniref:Uncharacterized protein n=1 Tax=Miscanthus lutarioriparius TaxID=422564 RepID=A0A811MU62_9POAL|nr:unnamed protein product [Miscanthus lutarioriparius]